MSVSVVNLLIVTACFILPSTNGQESTPDSSPRPTWPTPTWPEDAVVVAGDLGTIQGLHSFTSPNGKKFFWFAGIPYAKNESYMGENRFRPSSLKTGPLKENDEPFYAVNPLVFCPQGDIFYNTDTNMSDLGSVLTTYRKSLKRENKQKFRQNPRFTGQEDCLVINVNTPKIPKDGDLELFPVLFFIHGGSFDSIWGAVFGGQRFINRDVVVVSINYRLGLLGSLNLGNEIAPGNAAMYDVITALQWVQTYIHHFGGDKNSVTVSGHSAGAVMATHLLTSPLLKDSNLFHKVIGLSGSSVSAWTTCTDPVNVHRKVATHLNCLSDDNEEVALCMREKTIDELMLALDRWEGEEETEGRFGFDVKVPSIQIQSSIPSTPIFMEETPLNVFLKGEQKNIPVLLGATRHDGSFVAESTYDDFLRREGWLDDMEKLRNEFFHVLLKGLGVEDTTGGAMVHSMAHTYLGPSAMNSDNFTDMIPGLIDIHSVIAFKAGAYNLLELHSKLNRHSYYFAFDYYGLWTVDGGDVIPGVGHIDSVFYLFQAFPLFVWPNDLAVSRRFVDIWVNFATYGNPNGPEGSDISFPPFDAHTHTYLIINTTDRIGYNCRDSWVDNSLEIKDHSRPGWPNPTWPTPSPSSTMNPPVTGETTPSTGTGSTSSNEIRSTTPRISTVTVPDATSSSSGEPSTVGGGSSEPTTESFACSKKPFLLESILIFVVTIYIF